MCGIAFIRLRKPFEYYQKKYGSNSFALKKLHLMMEKQHNRGQDGAGMVAVKINAQPGTRYIFRRRSVEANYIADLFNKCQKRFKSAKKKHPKEFKDPKWVYNNVDPIGEVLLGHLRYGTHGSNSIDTCHPFMRKNNWRSRVLITAGNFNLTNVDQLFNQLKKLGQHPKEKADTVTILEKIGHFVDEANQTLFDKFKKTGLENEEISQKIADELNIKWILEKSAKDFDGGYVLGGVLGHGDAFVMRDPNGIRPGFYFVNEEFVVAASERPAIQTAFNIKIDEVKEIPAGNALIVKRDGSYSLEEIIAPRAQKGCSFERIYFSRGTDGDIYKERKELGVTLTDAVLKAVDYDLDNTVFSYIPNTAETCFYGLIKGVEKYIDENKQEKILALGSDPDPEVLARILSEKPRVEKMAVKDAKLRTFITDDNDRDNMVSHVYDITYGVIKRGVDNLVIVDDSIVRGTTLKKSIISILDRLQPKQIVVVSSAPQIRYPDCYGIDMSKMGDFVAFKAAEALLKERGQARLMQEVKENAEKELLKPVSEMKNMVKQIYSPLSTKDISKKIAEIVTADHVTTPVKVIYQSIEGLHKACPNHHGDWYFTGNFPTPGGNRVVNKSYVNYMNGINERAY